MDPPRSRNDSAEAHEKLTLGPARGQSQRRLEVPLGPVEGTRRSELGTPIADPVCSGTASRPEHSVDQIGSCQAATNPPRLVRQ